MTLLERRKVGCIDRGTLRLTVWTARVLTVWPGVPGKPEPVQVGDQSLGVRLLAPLRIGIFDAQQEAPAGAARQKLVEERRACVAKVQVPGRTRRKAGNGILLGHGERLRRIAP